MPIRVVYFDVGETLVDERRMWAHLADDLGVTLEDVSRVLADTIRQGVHHSQVIAHLRPDLDIDTFRAERAGSSNRYVIEARDLYPDAAPCLSMLSAAGYRIGIAGNQPKETEAALAGMGLSVDLIASSSGWGVEKPSQEFFNHLIHDAGVPAAEIAYVGDRIDNDILPALLARLSAIFLIRGPWGEAHATRSVPQPLSEISKACQQCLPNFECRAGSLLSSHTDLQKH